MAAPKNGKKELSKEAKMGIGIGLTTAALAAAGAYFLVGSKNAAKNRKKVKGWTLKAKGDVLEALEKAKEITAEEYGELVETATKAYGTVKDASKSEVRDFKNEMLEHWGKLEKNKAVRKITGAVEKAASKKKATPRKSAKTSAHKIAQKPTV